MGPTLKRVLALTISTVLIVSLCASSGGPVVSTYGGSRGQNTGDVTLSAFGTAANANGATLSGQVLNMEPASANLQGGVSNTTQTFNGTKSFDGGVNVYNEVNVFSALQNSISTDGGYTGAGPYVTSSLSSTSFQSSGGVQAPGLAALGPAGVDGGLIVSGNSNVQNLQVAGNAGVDAGLIIVGTITASGTVTVQNSLNVGSVGGTTIIQNALDSYSTTRVGVGNNNFTTITGAAANTNIGATFSVAGSGDTNATAEFTYKGDAGVRIQTYTVPVMHSTTGWFAIEIGQDAGATGAMTYDFTVPFISIPVCVCSDTNGTAPVACGIRTISTARVTAVATGAGSDILGVQCIGPR